MWSKCFDIFASVLQFQSGHEAQGHKHQVHSSGDKRAIRGMASDDKEAAIPKTPCNILQNHHRLLAEK
jgi:hypothetical protein